MSNNRDAEYLGVMADMAGCPNRCRHCWLGSHANGNMTANDLRGIARQFKNRRGENGTVIKEFGFFSWWREPDFRNDYRELWELEKELSSPGRARRFELLSVWRLARDESYAKWAFYAAKESAQLAKASGFDSPEPKACQITFFGMEQSTDWGINRAGAFRDNLTATERLIEAGIAPRWQVFLTKRTLSDLDGLLRLVYKLELHKRCEAIGHKFEIFIGGISPEGNGFQIENERIEEGDIKFIPQSFTDICREGTELLGRPEHELMQSMLQEDAPPMLAANVRSISINANCDVYPNIAEPTEWWQLGNLKTDGADAVLKACLDETSPGMAANRTIPVKELARRYGDAKSKKLYTKDDLLSRFLHQWGIEQARPHK
ncbi:MAG: radical SAM protein [Defluviitaleaceae bacterium]|nr:radical SAM protein [Defluviitaleaceae bacterium]